MTFKHQKLRSMYGEISNPYRKQTQKSYKQMTVLEHKQKEILSQISQMDRKAFILGKLRHITNEIASNCVYHDKNIEELHKKYSVLKVPQEEIDILARVWKFKINLAKSLLRDMEKMLSYAEESYNDKEK